jgi:hypothetical protein
VGAFRRPHPAVRTLTEDERRTIIEWIDMGACGAAGGAR